MYFFMFLCSLEQLNSFAEELMCKTESELFFCFACHALSMSESLFILEV